MVPDEFFVQAQNLIFQALQAKPAVTMFNRTLPYQDQKLHLLTDTEIPPPFFHIRFLYTGLETTH